MERVLFAGGGTGGHVYMAVALRADLSRRYPTCKFLFVGTEAGLENRILPPLSFPVRTIDIRGLKGMGLGRKLRTLAQIPKSLWQARSLLRDFAPEIVIGLGGYSSGPVIVAARLGGYPAILIEPNVVPGLTNRLAGRWVQGAAVAFEETASWFPGKAHLTGIPIRPEFHGIPARVSFTLPLKMLVFGGSRGSQDINRLVCEALPHLDPNRIEIRHQTGRDDFQEVAEGYEEARFPGHVTPYIDDMPAEMEWSDLIVSRAGACTVAEIAAAGRASILIPFPHAADDHQRKNALALKEKGASVMLDQLQTSGRELAGVIMELLEDSKRLKAMSLASRTLAQPKSVRKIIGLMAEITADRS